MAEISQVLKEVRCLQAGLENALEEIVEAVSELKDLNREVIQQNKELQQQNKKQQRIIEKFLENPKFQAQQEIESHEKEYRTAGLRVFLAHFPSMWADEQLKSAYRAAVVSAGYVRSPELISELTSWLWKWATNLRSNLLKTKGDPSHFKKSVESLGGVYSPENIEKGDADQDILVILQKYFRDAAVTDLPDNFDQLINTKIKSWRVPFVRFASDMDWTMTDVITEWKKGAAVSVVTPESSQEPDSSKRARKRNWFSIQSEGGSQESK